MACLLTMLTIFVVTQHRLSDGGIRAGHHDTPELWQPVHHGSAVTATLHAARTLDCPLVLSLARNSPYAFTSADGGVSFDLDADGDRDRVAWTAAESDVAFLALDQNGDTRITSGKELVGRHTVPGATNGVGALMRLAEQLSGTVAGSVDRHHPLLSRLLLWTDRNHNGVSEAAELRPAHHVLSDIGLGYFRHHLKDQHGNESRFRSFVHVRTEAGTGRTSLSPHDEAWTRWIYDVCLESR